MRAVLCKRYGPPSSLIIEDVPSLVACPSQVVIDVHACGVNFPDSLVIQGTYQFQPALPFSPGGEVAGVVKGVGPGVTAFRVGDRVFATMTYGGYAEEALAEVRRMVLMPDGMDFNTAATFMVAYGTSHHALKDRADLQPGETLLVLGAAGGVGLAAVEVGKAMGARVIAAASSGEKLAVCRQHGADALINYVSDDLRSQIKMLTDGRGVDVVYDPVGGQYSEPALRSTAWGGRFLVVGFSTGQIPALPFNLPLLKGCSIVGVFWGLFANNDPERNAKNSKELLTWLGQGKLHPHISASYPLERASEALTHITNRTATGKVVLTTRD